MDLLSLLDMTQVQFIFIIVVAFLVGFSKTGIRGAAMLAIPTVAAIFGGKESTGILLPMLIVADIFAITMYRRSADWKKILKVIPFSLIGLLIGVLTGNIINDNQFKVLIGLVVLVCLILLIYMEKKGENIKLPNKIWFYLIIGILCGFASMVGNAAAPIFTVYLLALGLRKNEFIGTSAWFFFILNITKVPLQVFFWENINLDNLFLLIFMFIPIAVGAFSGYYLVKRIEEKSFRYIAIIMTAIASLRLFF